MRPGISQQISYDQISNCLTEGDNEAYNIALLGPTGSGKSTIINNIFNKYVCGTGATAQSVTKEVKFLQGRIDVSSVLDQGQTVKKLNVIDTIGTYLHKFRKQPSAKTYHFRFL